MLSPVRALLLGLFVLLGASGASCPKFLKSYPSTGTRAIPKTATLADVVSVVNANSAKIRSLYSTDAAVSVSLMPSLKANLALERPKRFRLRAETGITGPEVDLGSNDSLFWLWVKRMQPAAIYYCSHKQFPTSAIKQFVPVEPDWLIDALGITGFDPAGKHTGPLYVRGGRLEIRTELPRPEGAWTKVTMVDAVHGFVMEQHLYDQKGTRVASSLTSHHLRDPESEAIIPRQVEIQWPATQFTLKLELKSLQVNRLSGDPAQLFEMPTYAGYTPTDAGDPSFQPVRTPTAFAPPPMEPTPRRFRLFR
jgi:hypothetical protein